VSSSAPAVIVTGAANGIGAASVLELARRGARVLAIDLDPRVHQLSTASAGEVVPHIADVTDGEAVAAAVASAVDQFGALNAIFNNAGILGATAPITDYPDELFERVFAVNVRGVYHGMKHAIPALRAAGGGVILNTASTGALVAAPAQAPYVASKHAVLGLTRSVALELAAEGISVNALCPGATDTPMLAEVIEGWDVSGADAVRSVLESVTPTGRMGRPEEIAEVAVWLLLDAPEYLTGTPIAVDGAQTAR
jgi:NAD(P)-dependent dehydrogenase (short-subunit alcohol dehydrogenase family)